MHSRLSLSADLCALGVSPGDVIMAHASVRAIGELAGGPDQIHLAIKDTITPTGALMMYASCPDYYDEVGRGNLSAADEAELAVSWPTERVRKFGHFRVCITPSQPPANGDDPGRGSWSCPATTCWCDFASDADSSPATIIAVGREKRR